MEPGTAGESLQPQEREVPDASGGFVRARSDSLVELLAPEREATIFHHRPPGGDIEFRPAENLIRFEEAIGIPPTGGGTVSALVLSQNNEKTGNE